MSMPVTHTTMAIDTEQNPRWARVLARDRSMDGTLYYRAGGANTAIRFAVGECSLGSILAARSEKGVCAIAFGDDPDALVRDLQDRFPRARFLIDREAVA